MAALAAYIARGDRLAGGVEIVGQLGVLELLDQYARSPFAIFVAAHAVGDRPEAVAFA